jgi:hypothetical protein
VIYVHAERQEQEKQRKAQEDKTMSTGRRIQNMDKRSTQQLQGSITAENPEIRRQQREVVPGRQRLDPNGREEPHG